MAKQSPKKSRKSTSKNKKTNRISHELTGILYLFAAVLGISQLGFAGILTANFFRFFFGEIFIVPLGLFGIYGLYLLIMGNEPRLRKKYILSGILLLLASMLYLHAASFQTIASAGGSVFQVTLVRFLSDTRASTITGTMGGGMIGAILYMTTHFLVAQWGTFVIIGLLIFLGICTILGMSTHDVMQMVRKVLFQVGNLLKIGYGWISNRLSRQWTSLKERFINKTNQNKTTTPSSIEESGEDSVQEDNWLSKARNKITKGAETNEAGENQQSTDGSDIPASVQLTIDSYQRQQENEEKLFEKVPPSDPTIASRQKTGDEQGGEENETDLEFEIKEETENRDYILPENHLLNDVKPTDQSQEYGIIEKNVKKLEETFKSFGVDAKVRKANLGPAVTKYEIQPAVGVKVSKIVSLADDIALALAAKDIRLEAPIPGKSFIGIEVPNSEVSTVSFRNVMEGQKYTEKLLEVPLGRDISGIVQTADLTKMPHLLIAGATGSGKSVCINGIITSILMKAKPNEVKMMMIDPKKVELNVYNGIPHLLTPVVTNPRKAAQALHKVVAEMERRYELFAGTGMRNIDGYNDLITEHNLEKGEDNPRLPYIVVIVDELADLMMVASNEVEDAITRLAQMARAAGIHMILATQRPSVDVITGIIKANVPSRVAFAVSSSTDSRTIIDGGGAEKLLGRGDMLFRPMGENKPIRIQGAFISDAEVERVVSFVKDQQEANYSEEMMQLDSTAPIKEEPEDELFHDAIEFIRNDDTASISKLQRRFRIGYNRAARMIDDMEARGIVGPPDGSKPRKVNISDEIYPQSTELEDSP
ncbi:DNA translocase FtsK [Jeotgalibaca sp. MA1X17-3]|uniref:DNA translocase FtsK n=1 Tax=Jeotgalibaca sp. MA1X17-3 TaxID=2908211 RepID=UPI001F491820|nr:DNA translocase FtsK [Jeotgalibaca sp. MA1X17-3]UJF14878.1 DNA translocase FtsK [Jeotgalibaca sp. MA1X17-3]